MRIFEYRNEFHESEIKQSRYPSKQICKIKGIMKSDQKPLNVALLFMPWLCIGFQPIKREFVYGAASLQLVNVNFTF